MIIYGTTGIRSTMSNGNFYCPHCNEQRAYRQRKLVKWATLYFIPIFPMERVAEYVECSHCRSTYEVSVLDFDPNWERKFMERYTMVFANALFEVLKSGGMANERRKLSALQEFEQFVGRKVAMKELDELFTIFDNQSPKGLIEEMAPELKDEGKAIILKAVINVAMADGNLGESGKNAISSIAEKLGVSQTMFRNLLVESNTNAVPA